MLLSDRSKKNENKSSKKAKFKMPELILHMHD